MFKLFQEAFVSKAPHLASELQLKIPSELSAVRSSLSPGRLPSTAIRFSASSSRTIPTRGSKARLIVQIHHIVRQLAVLF